MIRAEERERFDVEQGGIVAAQRFGIPAQKVRFVQASENYVYDAGDVFLRITPFSHRSESQLEGELSLMRWLVGAGVATVAPAPSAAGRWVEPSELGNITAIKRAPGRSVEAFGPEWNESLFRAWGRTMAEIHLASQAWPDGALRWEWDGDPLAVAIPAAVGSDSAAMREYERLRSRLDELSGESYGVIHGDLGRPNFHLDEGCVIAFDFDDCGRHWHLYDLAVSLWPLRGQAVEDRRRYRTWMDAGYAEVRPVPEGDFDLFLRWRHLCLYAANLAAWTEPDEAQAAWLARAAACFESPLTWGR